MSATKQSSTLDTYREAVEDLMDSGEGFGDVEEAIDDVVCLTLDQKAALWLFAFSLGATKRCSSSTRAHIWPRSRSPQKPRAAVTPTHQR